MPIRAFHRLAGGRFQPRDRHERDELTGKAWNEAAYRTTPQVPGVEVQQQRRAVASQLEGAQRAPDLGSIQGRHTPHLHEDLTLHHEVEAVAGIDLAPVVVDRQPHVAPEPHPPTTQLGGETRSIGGRGEARPHLPMHPGRRIEHPPRDVVEVVLGHSTSFRVRSGQELPERAAPAGAPE